MKLVLLNAKLGMYMHIFQARQYRKQGEDPTPDAPFNYSCDFIVEKGSKAHKNVMLTIQEAAKTQYGAKWQPKLKMLLGQVQKCAYVSNDLKEAYSEFEGSMILSAKRNSAKGPPHIINRSKDVVTIQDGVFYPGCEVNAVLDVYIQTGTYPGVRCQLNTLQFVADGDPISPDTPTDDDLPELDDIGEDTDGLEGDDDLDDMIG